MCLVSGKLFQREAWLNVSWKIKNIMLWRLFFTRTFMFDWYGKFEAWFQQEACLKVCSGKSKLVMLWRPLLIWISMFFGIGVKCILVPGRRLAERLSCELHICLAPKAPFYLDFYVFRYREKLDPGSIKKPDSKFAVGNRNVSCSGGPFWFGFLCFSV